MDIPSTSKGNPAKAYRNKRVRADDKDFEEKVMKWYMERDSEFEDVDDSNSDPDYIMTDKGDEEIEEETNTKNNQRNKNVSENTSENSDQECDLLETIQEIVAMDNNDDVENGQFFIEKNNKIDFVWSKHPPPATRGVPSHNIIRQITGLTRKANNLGNPTIPEIWKCLFDQQMIIIRIDSLFSTGEYRRKTEKKKRYKIQLIPA
ncbi:unnamed protein product [Psylliodes chrysocephalus]|uniref:Uncharacterized protein n=1 Tax=Psylliodes chrysocephalus TaxID=3402493 RepID=A0A9P0G7F4_9CUCU|nr:unnamed protein product [Psylliodes chrysocephala]